MKNLMIKTSGPEMVPGQKLDDLPNGKPHTYDDVMRALTLLHKLVLKQAEHYGGKDSKLFLAQVVEGSLLQQVELGEGQIDKDFDEVDRLMDIARRRAEDLADHLKSKGDKEGLNKFGAMLQMLNAAMGISRGYAKK